MLERKMAQRRSKENYHQVKDIFRELSDLLRENGEKILSGQSKLSLTTNCLNSLNDNFANISDEDFTTSFEVVPPNTPKLPQYHDLQFLYDIVQKTISLKLIHGSNTLQGRVNLAAFRSLQSLELKKTPLHMLEGINKMRRKLTTLICTRCLRQIQDLIETCGGDMSSPVSWQNLHTVSFSYNSISQLDSSMRLLPALEVLDLSHNDIKTTENYLEYLTEIQVASLGFNQLERIPTFSLSGRQKLQTLILKNNNLDTIYGIEELIGLRELDLANNCLCDHRDLEPIKALHRLSKLSLEGNPLCYHPQHRIRSLENVHPLSLGRLVLDGRSVNQQEVVYCRKYHNLSDNSWSNISIAPDTSRRLPHVSSASSFDFDRSSPSQNDSGEIVTKGRATKLAKRKSFKNKRGPRRARKAEISDGDDMLADNSSEASYSSTPHDDSYMEIRQNLETARQQLGPDWLQYLVHNKASTMNKREELARQAIVANGTKPEATDDDIFLNAEEPIINSDSKDVQQTKKEGTSKSKSNTHSTNDSPDTKLSPNDKKSESRQRIKSQESDIVINWKGSSTEPETDYGAESEPFIVSHPDDENQNQMLITVTERYVLEKDLNGDVLESLDLKCLQSISLREEMIATISMEGVHVDMHVVRLTFDYVKKNRRERAYIMEDLTSAQEFEELLRPALEANLAALKMKDLMHCLKCGRDFGKSEAEVKVKKFGNQSNSDIYSSNMEKNTLEEIMLCPYCGGSMIIQVENQQQQIAAGGGSNFATPVGSYTMPFQDALGSPRKHSTPAKLIQEDNTSLVSSSFKSIPENSFASLTLHTANDSKQTTFGPDSTVYKSMVTNTLNSTDASFDVLDSSKKQGSSDSELMYHSSKASSLIGSQLLKGMTAMDNKKPSIESASRNLFNSGQGQKRISAESAPVRNRQDSNCSTGSDIIVLKQQASQEGSDITLLSNPSQSSIAVIDQEPCLGGIPENDHLQLDRHSQPVTFTIAGEALPSADSGSRSIGQRLTESTLSDAEHSPMGSLTCKTLNSMVSSMYEKSLTSDNASTSSNDSPRKEKGNGLHRVSSNDSFLSATGDSDIVGQGYSEKVEIKAVKGLRTNFGVNQDSSPSIYSTSPALSVGSGSGAEDSSKLYRQDNCNYIDHRLKLHLMMNIFSQDEEDFSLILKCGCVHFNKGDEYPCLFVISSTSIYIIKIIGEESGNNFEKWLKLVQGHLITNLQYVDIGLGHQSFHAEFATENASFTFLIRDEKRCKSFLRQFTKLVTSQTASSKSRLEGISKHNSITLANLESQVLHVNSTEEDMDTEVLKFSQGYLHTGELNSKGEKSLSPVSILVTPTHIFLINENYNWPLPRSTGSAGAPIKQRQFELRDRQRINDITSIDLYQVAPREMSVHFLDEETNEDCSWHVAMETDDALMSLIGTVRQPWESQFGVELQISVVQCEDPNS